MVRQHGQKPTRSEAAFGDQVERDGADEGACL
jgi:hypothetical protein